MLTKLSRRQSGVTFEHPGKVGLVSEAGDQSDLGKGQRARRKLARCVLHAQAALVVTDRATIVSAKCAGQVYRVNAGVCGDFVERNCL